MIEPPLTPAGRRHMEAMLRAVAPHSSALERRFRALLRSRERTERTLSEPVGGFERACREPLPGSAAEIKRYKEARIKALTAITPAAAARLGSLSRFFEQVDYCGRRLAKLDVAPNEARNALHQFAALLDETLDTAWQPAREQLRLATVFTLNEAYRAVREAEADAFFGLYRAEVEESGLEEMLRRFVHVLARALRARAGRLMLVAGTGAGKLARPLYIERGGPHERLVARDLLRGGCACFWSHPVGDSAVLQLGFPTPYPWLPRELALLSAAGQRCQEAIEHARLRDDVRRLNAEALHAEEDERRRIGRELHDEAGQSLLCLRLELEMLERQAPEPLAARLRGTREIAENTIAELRRIVAALSPAVLERLGLRAALRHLAARFRSAYACELQVRIAGRCDRLRREEQEIIYRVAQEALQNVVKHSGATRVIVLLHAADRKVRLRVADNGAGFRANRTKSKPGSFGVWGMRERAALLGGTLEIRSAPGEGAVVLLELPQGSAPSREHVENSRTVN